MTNDFLLLSPGSRAPADVFLAKRIAEVRRELDYRRRVYPAHVAQGRMTDAESKHELLEFEAIALDLDAARRLEETGVWAMPGNPQDPEAVHQAWEAKVRSLRRELAMRRNFYGKRIEQGRLTADQATKHIERLEAVHWMYWCEGFCMVPPLPGAWLPGHPDYAGAAATEIRRLVRDHAARLMPAEAPDEPRELVAAN